METLIAIASAFEKPLKLMALFFAFGLYLEWNHRQIEKRRADQQEEIIKHLEEQQEGNLR